jgi:anti-sigma factor RsiW
MTKIHRLTQQQRDDLTAYLDGELDDAATHEIEQVLAQSPVARNEVEMLTRTWEMLSLLPRAQAGEDFT